MSKVQSTLAPIVALFTPGMSYNRETFIRIANILYPVRFAGLSNIMDIESIVLVSIQGAINKTLRKYGRVLKSVNYYSSFEVVSGGLALKEVARYTRTAKTMNKNIDILSASLDSLNKVDSLKI